MIEHIVCFQFKEVVSEKSQFEIVETLLAFENSIPGIVNLSAGVNVTEEVNFHHGYSIGLRVTFENEDALRDYQTHPIHQQFVNRIKEDIQNIVVVDYPIHS
ncbi:Dabb family protein [Bacillus solitudinis]|uniref:Dabb family protein n=1 Tax=Bacillus solitudinis TaxID=2014074 RepID=UPI0012FDDF10|nr:Dabb family protein [Bacillus solitudinis]